MNLVLLVEHCMAVAAVLGLHTTGVLVLIQKKTSPAGSGGSGGGASGGGESGVGANAAAGTGRRWRAVAVLVI